MMVPEAKFVGESHKTRSIEPLNISAASSALAKEIVVILDTAEDHSGSLLGSLFFIAIESFWKFV